MSELTTLAFSNLGPFRGIVRLDFAAGVTYICGGNGSGKTTIALALVEKLFGKVSPNADKSETQKVPRWLGCWSEDYEALPYGGAPYGQLVDYFRYRAPSHSELELLAAVTAEALHELLEHKVSLGSKFTGSIASSKDIAVSIANDGTVSLANGSRADLSWGFQATGERMALYLALNRAIRRVLVVESAMPFIFDNGLGVLDAELQQAMSRFLGTIASQVIVLDKCGIFASLGLTPHYALVSRHVRTEHEWPTGRLCFGGQELVLDEYGAKRDESVVMRL